jgi:hypothetical protein
VSERRFRHRFFLPARMILALGAGAVIGQVVALVLLGLS